MSDFQNPRNQLLLIECRDDAEMVEIGVRSRLLSEINTGFGLEWPARSMVLQARRGYRRTGVWEETEEGGEQEILEWSKTQYCIVVDADMDDPRWHEFRIVREPQSWIIPGWDSEE